MKLKEDIKYLGVDWGEKRIGLALADNETRIALAFKTVKNIKELLLVIDLEAIDYIIIGKPNKLSGAEASNANYLNFLNKLESLTKISLIDIDERLSSKAADVLGYGGKNRASRDEGAATLILQSYLDSIN